MRYYKPPGHATLKIKLSYRWHWQTHSRGRSAGFRPPRINHRQRGPGWILKVLPASPQHLLPPWLNGKGSTPTPPRESNLWSRIVATPSTNPDVAEPLRSYHESPLHLRALRPTWGEKVPSMQPWTYRAALSLRRGSRRTPTSLPACSFLRGGLGKLHKEAPPYSPLGHDPRAAGVRAPFSGLSFPTQQRKPPKLHPRPPPPPTPANRTERRSTHFNSRRKIFSP